MNEELVARLRDYWDECPGMLLGRAKEREVRSAMQELGFSEWDSEYDEFVRMFGGGIVGSLPVYGVGMPADLGGPTSTVVEVNRMFVATGFPVSGMLVVSMDLAGNPIGIDHEGRVVVFDHDAGVSETLSNSFDGFLGGLLDARETDTDLPES